MPALLTHDFMGRDLLQEIEHDTVPPKDERDAFLLGSQGPDPLFFTRADPRHWPIGTWNLGSVMHNERPARLLFELKQSLGMLQGEEAAIGRAYAHGFLAHYALDRTVHPLVYAMEYRICDAGVEGLSRENKSEVHHLIESEFDEMVLYRRTGGTIGQINPTKHTLKASKRVLSIVGKMYLYLALATYGRTINAETFAHGVRSYRFVEHLVYSPRGIKREALANIEEVARPYSVLRALARRPVKLESTWFANPKHLDWENPFTGELSRTSFDDLYQKALKDSLDFISAFEEQGFDENAAQRLTGNVNFSGDIADDAYREGMSE